MKPGFTAIRRYALAADGCASALCTGSKRGTSSAALRPFHFALCYPERSGPVHRRDVTAVGVVGGYDRVGLGAMKTFVGVLIRRPSNRDYW